MTMTQRGRAREMRLKYRESKKDAAEPVTACGTGAPELALSVSRVQILAAAAAAGQLTLGPRRGAPHDPPRQAPRLGQMFLNPNTTFLLQRNTCEENEKD